MNVADYFRSNWDKTKTHNKKPFIGFNPPDSELNYHVAIIFKERSDDIDELGLDRSHQSSGSFDLFECICIETSQELCKDFRDEVRRICRLKFSGDEDYTMFDWSGGTWGGGHNRRTFILNILAFRSGVPFS